MRSVIWLEASVVRQTEIHTEEPLVPEPIAFEVEMAIEKLKHSKDEKCDLVRG